MFYLLDTNHLSDLVRNPSGRVANRIASLGEAHVFTSVVVSAELRYGAAKRGSKKLDAQVEAILAALTVKGWEVPCDRIYGELRAKLETQGNLVGPNDLLIAAHALHENASVATANVREFSRVKGLKVENWLS